jgi:hypothetical protein
METATLIAPAVSWTWSQRFTGWHGRVGTLGAPVFTVELTVTDGISDTWSLRSTLPGYASARWTFDVATEITRDVLGAYLDQPALVVRRQAAGVLQSFVDKFYGSTAPSITHVPACAYAGR